MRCSLLLFPLCLLFACGDDKATDDDGSADSAADGAADGAEDGAADGADGGSADGAADGGTDTGGDGGTDTGGDGGTDTGGDGGTDTGDTGGDTGGGDGVAESIEIAGSWRDDRGGDHVISDTAWVSFLGSNVVHLSLYDNSARWAVGENDASNGLNPGLWSRYDWAFDAAGAPYFCPLSDREADEAAALALPAADATSPAEGGCNDGPWLQLLTEAPPPPGPEIAGDWVDGWGSRHSITNSDWTSEGSRWQFTLIENTSDFIIAQNDAANAYFPGLWSRFDWTVDPGGQLWYCQSAYDAPTEGDAFMASIPDASAPSTGGCGGFPWSSLSPAP